MWKSAAQRWRRLMFCWLSLDEHKCIASQTVDSVKKQERIFFFNQASSVTDCVMIRGRCHNDVECRQNPPGVNDTCDRQQHPLTKTNLSNKEKLLGSVHNKSQEEQYKENTNTIIRHSFLVWNQINTTKQKNTKGSHRLKVFIVVKLKHLFRTFRH